MSNEQPMPNKVDGPAMQDLVIEDIQKRKQVGIERYGATLKAFNGRDALRDAYEESLDQTFYLKQANIEHQQLLAVAEAANRFICGTGTMAELTTAVAVARADGVFK